MSTESTESTTLRQRVNAKVMGTVTMVAMVAAIVIPTPDIEIHKKLFEIHIPGIVISEIKRTIDLGCYFGQCISETVVLVPRTVVWGGYDKVVWFDLSYTIPDIKLPDIPAIIAGTFQDLTQGIFSGIREALDGLVSGVIGAIDGLVSSVQELVVSTLTGAWNWFANGITGLLGGAGQFVVDTLGGIGNVLFGTFSVLGGIALIIFAFGLLIFFVLSGGLSGALDVFKDKEKANQTAAAFVGLNIKFWDLVRILMIFGAIVLMAIPDPIPLADEAVITIGTIILEQMLPEE